MWLYEEFGHLIPSKSKFICFYWTFTTLHVGKNELTVSNSSSSSSFTSFPVEQQPALKSASEELLNQKKEADFTGNLDGPICPVILLIWFIKIIYKVVFWIIIIISFLWEIKRVVIMSSIITWLILLDHRDPWILAQKHS